MMKSCKLLINAAVEWQKLNLAEYQILLQHIYSKTLKFQYGGFFHAMFSNH